MLIPNPIVKDINWGGDLITVHSFLHPGSLFEEKPSPCWPNAALHAAAHPLVVDCEVVVQVDDAFGLLQKLAVGGVGPPVHQVAVAIVLAPCRKGNDGMESAPAISLKKPRDARGPSIPASFLIQWPTRCPGGLTNRA